ncbi:DUF924 family protein [Aerosakkonemataceae cyanobacterium BLCC-F50]|uniref:DUF924 family protein n=1 Tax=Floridaenema flaviceps BLCC-F50 TaxID=3153642 RepID=A0ABV4XYM0_9CYAN
MANFQEILNFWFGTPDRSNYGKPRNIWFSRNSEFDQLVKTRFLSDYELAASGNLNHWQDLPESCLAFIILCDQFPRNMFRDRPKAFATDPQALALAQYAVERGFDRQFLPVQRWFFYLPFQHSENLEHQRQSLALFEQLGDDPDSLNCIDYAIQHLKIIERFGRFPHRNQILGRETTPEEAEFLKQPGSSF